jgi:outer membrane immunogenic protein
MGSAAAALTVAGAFAAQAADLPTRKEAPAPVFIPPPFTWTGFYVGVNAGGIWSNGGNANTTLFAQGFPFLTTDWPNGSIGSSNSGFIGGGQAGYNWQTGSFVLGVETDFDGTTASKSFNSVGNPFGPGTIITTSGGSIVNLSGDSLNVNASARLSWLGTTRARVGFVATPDNRLMIYGTGGVAYGGGSGHLSIFDNTSGLFWQGQPSSSRVGWTIGGGVEYAITNNITIKGEYLYYNLGSSNFNVGGNSTVLADFPGTFVNAKYTYDGSIIRAGVNYKF